MLETIILIAAVLGVLVGVAGLLQTRRAHRESVDPRLDIVQVYARGSGSDDDPQYKMGVEIQNYAGRDTARNVAPILLLDGKEVVPNPVAAAIGGGRSVLFEFQISVDQGVKYRLAVPAIKVAVRFVGRNGPRQVLLDWDHTA